MVSVKLITDEDYAALLRAQSDFAAIADRVGSLYDELAQYREAVARLAAVADGSAETQAAALADARNRGRALAGRYRELSGSFPVFEIEKTLAGAIGETATVLDRQGAELDAARPGVTNLRATAAHLLEELGASLDAMGGGARDARELAAVARLMEPAADLRAVVERQRFLVRRFRLAASSSDPMERARLPSLAREQDEVRGRLDGLVRDIRERAGGLPSAWKDLAAQAFAFGDLLAGCGASEAMTAASGAAVNQDVQAAEGHAARALQILLDLIDRNADGNQFAGMCRGRAPGAGGGGGGGGEGEGQGSCRGRPDARQTLAELLAGLLARGEGGRGSGGTEGSGGGIGGDRNDGYWMPGSSTLQVPLYGPGRDMSGPRLSESRFGGTGHGRGGPGAGSSRPDNTVVDERSGEALPRPFEGPVPPLELLPVKYQDAVRRYFEEGGEKR
jgi:hypothetical protein